MKLTVDQCDFLDPSHLSTLTKFALTLCQYANMKLLHF